MKNHGNGIVSFTKNEWNRRNQPLAGYRFVRSDDRRVYFVEVPAKVTPQKMKRGQQIRYRKKGEKGWVYSTVCTPPRRYKGVYRRNGTGPVENVDYGTRMGVQYNGVFELAIALDEYEVEPLTYYHNPRRIGQPFIYKNILMFENEQGRKTEMVSCIHQTGQFGHSICVACIRMINDERAEIEAAMKEAGFNE